MSQGIQLPVTLQLQNLADVASQLKQFAGKNILGDSLGGKKIEAELNSILRALGQIESRAKNAFKTNADFSGLEKDINRIELSIEHVQGAVQGLKFEDLKIPTEAAKEIADLNNQINNLKAGFDAFKGVQKENLLKNLDFTGSLAQAFDSKGATSILNKSYDEMCKAIDQGVATLQAKLATARGQLAQSQQELLNDPNNAGQKAYNYMNILKFLEQGFKPLSKDQSKWSEQQQMLSRYMQIDENGQFGKFKSGAAASQFYSELAKLYSLSPEQMTEIRKKITDSINDVHKTAGEALRAVATNRSLGAQVLGGKGVTYQALESQGNAYAQKLNQVNVDTANLNNVEGQTNAAANALRILAQAQQEVAAEQQNLNAALAGPQGQLDSLKASLLAAAQVSPQFSQACQQAATQINQLRATAAEGQAKLVGFDNAISRLSGVSSFVNRYVGAYAIMRRVTSAIKNAYSNIKDLDKAITNIAVVTNMSQKELWGKIGEYTSMAQEYGVATKDVYTVSQLFYQQGLQTNQVMSLTTETLKMAKISGMGYEEAANAMTVAIRAFNIEMSNAQQVTDVYSALAAKFAVSSAEIANAMEKTASSAANVGMSLESTSAFISVMEQTTRESAQNIGSALKSIISRYGEMKASPEKMLDVDGEKVAFNKVDTALQSIGVSIKDASGQFRDFDDVIMELASKWDTLDNNTQRYIATVMAGNRQQSRFIALVSNYDELNRAMDTANNAENASIVQVAKTMDSLETKTQQVKNAFSQLYLDLHFEDGAKSILDSVTNILKTIGKLGVKNGLLPSLANIIGIGTGTKAIINNSKQGIEAYKKKVMVDADEANQKADELNAKLQQTVTKTVQFQADMSQMQAIQVSLQNQANNTGMQAAQAIYNSSRWDLGQSGITVQSIYDRMVAAQSRGELKGKEAEFADAYGVKSDNPEAGNITSLLQNFGTLSSQVQQTGQTLTELQNAAQQAGIGIKSAGESGEKAAEGHENSAEAAQRDANAKQEDASSTQEDSNAHRESASANQEETGASRAAAEADYWEAEASRATSPELKQLYMDRAASIRYGLQQNQSKNNQPQQPTGQVPPRTNENPLEPPKREHNMNYGFSWGKHTAIQRGVGIATGVMRLAGTAIAASGASHEDQIGESYGLFGKGINGRGVEVSKIKTGIGNGLSMAGTGASMGMAFGPWGTAIGAIGGFLAGGLGAIIDGAEVTIEEEISMQKDKAKKASDEALKKQAAAIDFDSSLKQLKKLRENQYNSEEDMLAYKDAMQQMGQAYPQLISAFDASGNAIIDLTAAEEQLMQLRQESAKATAQAAKENNETLKLQYNYTKDLQNKIQSAYDTVSDTQTDYWGIRYFGKSVYKTEGSTILDSAGNERSIKGKKTKTISSGWGNKTTDEVIVQDYMGTLNEIMKKTVETPNWWYGQDDLDQFGQDFMDEIVASINRRKGANGNFIDNVQWTQDEVTKWAKYIDANRSGEVYKSGGVEVRGQTIATTENGKTYYTKDNTISNLLDWAKGVESGEETMEYSQDTLDALDKFVKTNKDMLGTQFETARDFFGWGDGKVKASDVASALRYVNILVEQSEKAMKNNEKSINLSQAESALNGKLLMHDEIDTNRRSSMSENKIYSNILASYMDKLAKDVEGLTSGGEWYNKDSSDYTVAASDAAENIMYSLLQMTDAQVKQLEEVMADLGGYTDINGLLVTMGIGDQSELGKGILEAYTQTQINNKKRILDTIYEGGSVASGQLNLDMMGLAKLNYTGSDANGGTVDNRNQAKDIAYRFWKGDIISKYSDYFTDQLVSINRMAEEGLQESAKIRLNTLDKLASGLSGNTDEVQRDLFGIITQMNFSDYDSIIEAKESIEQYGETTHVNNITTMLSELQAAANSLVFNINTLAESLVEGLREAADNVDDIIGTNKSGLTLGKALEEFENLKASGDITSFDSMFTYDTTLGKYIYTAEGLAQSIAVEEEALNKKVEKLDKTAKDYKERITTTTTDADGNVQYQSVLQGQIAEHVDQNSSKRIHLKYANMVSDRVDVDKDELRTREQLEDIITNKMQLDPNDPGISAALDDLERTQSLSVTNLINRYAQMHEGVLLGKSNYGVTAEITADVKELLAGTGNEDLITTYEDLANDFMLTNQEKTWDNFLTFIEEQAKDNVELYEATKEIQEEYEKNKKNQYFAGIDWAALDLGTDFTGSNKVLMDKLAQELGLQDEAGNWVDGVAKSWNEVMDKYFDEIYPDEFSKEAAKAVKKGQMAQSKSSQISSAINEVLAGEGSLLSETSLALINQVSGLNISAVDGVIQAGQNYVASALALYDAHKENLLSVAERNTAYTAILSKNFEQGNQIISTLSSGASLDLQTLGDTFTAFGFDLSQYYDATVEDVKNAWKTQITDQRSGLTFNNPFAEALETDIFGKTRIIDWDKFIAGVGLQTDISQYTGTFEYRNAYSSYVDGLITLDTQEQDLIKKSYDNAFSSITEWKPMNVSMIEKLRPDLAQVLQASGAANIEDGILTVNNAVQYAYDISSILANLSSKDSKTLMEQGWTKEDIAKNWKNAQTVITAVRDTWSGISENITSLSADNISTLVEKGGFNLEDLTTGAFTKIGDTYIMKLSAYSDYLVKAIGGEDATYDSLNSIQKEYVSKGYLKAQQAIVNKITGLDWTKMLEGTATEAEAFDFITGLRDSLASAGIALNDIMDHNNKLSIVALKSKLGRAVQHGDITQDAADQLISNLETTMNAVRDTALAELKTNAELLTSGTTNFADIDKFVQRYKQLTGKDMSIVKPFEYDELTQTYTLVTSAYLEYSQAQQEYLKSLGLSDKTIASYLKNQAQQLASEMDISGFVSGSDLSSNSKAAQTLMSQIKNWYAIHGVEITDTAINFFMQQLVNGGDDAVARLKEYKGEQNVSSDELVAVYKAQINRLQAAAEEIAEVTLNSIVTGQTINILSQVEGFEVKELGDGTGVVTAIGKMVDAYAAIYQRMKASAEATTAEINSSFAQLLTAKDQGNIDAIQALNDAMGMDYESLGNLLAQYGKGAWQSLEFTMLHQFSAGLESLGNGQVRITDFSKFAELMNWEVGGEAYVEAYNAYNDSLIELDHKMGKNITSEIKSIADAQTGDRVNLTYLQEALHMADEQINQYLENTGAEIKNGILTINEGARIGDIIAKLGNLVKSNGQLITSELAELADAVAEFLDNIVNLIKSGISGSLKNTEANTLKEWAQEYAGIEDLDFTKTADGLQLSQQSATQLYFALKQVDSLKASLVFDELSNSLKDSNENFKSASGLTAHIKQLQTEINKLKINRTSLNQEDAKSNHAKIQQYEQELALAKEILAVRSTQEDDSFNFMSNKIPGAQNNPLNYASNWTQALTKIKDAFDVEKVSKNGETGFIDYQDWYNIVTEMNNIAALGGPIKLGAYELNGSLESAAALIEKGAAALTTVDSGELKVNLKGIGVDISSGADMMGADVTKGIQTMAQSQVEMLDGLIALMEAIVSMEQLGDIDVDGNGIELDELFTVTYDENGNRTSIEINEAYDKWREEMRKQLTLVAGDEGYNEDLQNALKGIKIGKFSLADIINWDDAKFLDAEDSVQKAYMAILTAFSQAAKSGNYDLESIQESVLSVLAESGLTDTIRLDIGKMTYYVSGSTMTTINWESEDTQTILAELENEATQQKKTTRELLSGWIEQYGNGEIESNQALEYVLRVKNKITVTDGGVKIMTFNGTTYSSDNPAQWQAALGAAALQDLGYTVSDEAIQEAVQNAANNASNSSDVAVPVVVKTKTTIGDVEVDVESENGQVRLVGPHGKYKNQAEFLDEEWKFWRDENLDKSTKNKYTSKEEWKWGEYHIPTQIEPKFTLKETGVEADINNDPQLRDEVVKVMSGGRESINKLMQDAVDNGDGTYTVSIGGYSFKFTGGKNAAANLEKELGNQLGIDTALSNTITNAISNAIPIIIEGLGSVDAGPLQEVANALQDIFINLSLLSGVPFETIAAGLESINVVKSQGQSNQPKQPTPQTPSKAPIGSAQGPQKAQPAANTPSTSTATPNLEEVTDDLSNLSTVVDQTDPRLAKVVQSTQAQGNAAQQAAGQNSAAVGPVTQYGATVTSTGGAASGATGPLGSLAAQATALAVAAGLAAVATIGAVGGLNSLASAIRDIPVEKTHTVKIKITASSSKGNAQVLTDNPFKAFSFAKGNALSQGTLMGELGPELVVSGGGYFVVGQSGAEFVDLAPDAIVFNHKQTAALLSNGKTGRGKPITNEENAISWAKGSINGGPAMASASAALAALKQLRAEWQALAGLSVQDLAGKGGDAGGGGGGGGNQDKQANFIKDLEKWYNWLQKIAQLEKEITQYESERSKYQSDLTRSGKEYATVQLNDILPALKDEAAYHKSLYESQQKSFAESVEKLNTQNGPFTALYGFDEKTGQLEYKDGALAKLSDLAGRDQFGKANYSVVDQYNEIIKMNPDFEKYMQYDSSGNDIFANAKKKPKTDKNGKTVTDDKGNVIESDEYEDAVYQQAVQAFWDKIEADKQEMQSLHDSIEEHKNALLQNQQKINEAIKQIEDNQIAVENKVLSAIEDSRQRAIDEAQKERDAIEKASTALINGLTQQLEKERTMYSNQQTEDELAKLQRQLGILQRSGGSASQIADLQQQISDKMQDQYFNEQQQEIDALQEASDNQLEKLDAQINIMTESLEYEKKHGLLWEEVAKQMSKSPEEIADYIMENDSQFWEKSPIQTQQAYRETLFEADQWAIFRKEGGLDKLITAYNDLAIELKKQTINEEGKQEEPVKPAEPAKPVKPDKNQGKGDGDKGGDKGNKGNEDDDNNKTATKYKATYKLPDGKEYSVTAGTEDDAKRLAQNKITEYCNAHQIYALERQKLRDAIKITSYDIGGMVEETGPALLHAKEGVLTEKQTSILRNEILGNSKNSALNTLRDLRDFWNKLDISGKSLTTNKNSTENAVVIKQISLEMNIAEIANDYDAKRAGEQALERIMEVAKKTSAQNRIGG